MRVGSCPHHLFAERQLAVLLQAGDQQRLRAAHIAAPHVESRRAGGPRHISANHGQLPARHLHPRRVVGQAAVPEILRRAERRRRVRQRPPRGRAPRRMDGVHLRDHTLPAIRRQQLGAGDGQQLLPERHTAHLVGDKLLRRHLPRRGADRDRADYRVAALLRLGRRARAPEQHHRQSGGGHGVGMGHLDRRQGVRPGHHGARPAGRRRVYALPERAHRARQTRRHTLHHRGTAAVELQRAQPLHRHHRHRPQAGGRSDRRHGIPQDRGDARRGPEDQRREDTRARRDALPRPRRHSQRAAHAPLRRGHAADTRHRSQRHTFGHGAARAVSLRLPRPQRPARVDRHPLHPRLS